MSDRHLSEVIEDLIAAEPQLADVLESSLMRTRYSAPEMMVHVWNDVALILSARFPNRVDLQAIYNGDQKPCDPNAGDAVTD